MTSTKERILTASEELFRRQGLIGTGIKQILAAADAPFGSLYHHFPGGKDELAAETIRRAGDYYGTMVANKFMAAGDLPSGIKSSFADAGATLENTDFADACPIETVALEVASTNEPLRMATADVFDSWIDGLTAMLAANGIHKATARSLALTILSALEGAFVLARSTRRTDALVATGAAMAQLVEAAIADANNPDGHRRSALGERHV